MFILYVDESGVDELNVPPPHFVLLGLMIPAAEWKILDGAIEGVKGRYGLAGVEIHSAWMARRFSEQEKVSGFVDLDRQSRLAAFHGEVQQRSGVLGVRGNKKKIKAYRREVRETSRYAHLTHDERLRCLRDLAAEFADLLEFLEDTTRRPTRPLDSPAGVPLHLHADYQLAEIMAAFAVISPDTTKLVRPQAGVFWHGGTRSDLFFVTLQKSEKDYSPTTMYEDYPISPTLFHWQSQSVTREASDTGQRYINHASLGSQILLFARNTAKDARGETSPYTFLGPATYVTHEGERPMSITWRLAHPMPPDMFEETKVVAG